MTIGGRPADGCGGAQKRSPGEGVDRDHDHHRRQRRHRHDGEQASAGATSRTRRKAPATSVDKRPRPPEATLMTDWPIMAQPPMPPNVAEAMLATPWPRHSRAFAARRIGHVVDDLGRQQRFEQADRRERQGDGRDDAQRLEHPEGPPASAKTRQGWRAAPRARPPGPHVELEQAKAMTGQHGNGDERRGDRRSSGAAADR